MVLRDSEGPKLRTRGPLSHVTRLELFGHVGVGPPVAEVGQALLGAAEDPGLDQPDTDHCPGPAFTTWFKILQLL